jgi:hypothetical protein
MVIAATTNIPAAESRFHRIRVGPRLRCVELGGIVRHAQAPINQETREGVSAGEAINDGLGHVVIPGKLGALPVQASRPVNNGTRERIGDGSAVGRCFAVADFLLQPVSKL